MYNPKPIESFIDKVTKEAETAAQEIFDKYTPELIEKIKNQMQDNDKIYVSMGCAGFANDKPYWGYGEKFLKEVSDTQYPSLTAGFNLPDTISKA